MTPLRQLIAKGGTRTFTKAELEAEAPSLAELLCAYIDARERGDDRRAVAYREVAVRRVLEQRSAAFREMDAAMEAELWPGPEQDDAKYEDELRDEILGWR